MKNLLPIPLRRRARQAGFTMMEAMAVATILGMLTVVAFPLVRSAVREQKEMQLRLALNKLRSAIDEYKRYCDAGLLGEIELGSRCYPVELETLLEPYQLVGQLPDSKVRFLHRIPEDPMTRDIEWGLRSYEDDPDSDYWGGEDVYDVYSLSDRTGLNGIPYRDW